MLIRCSHSSITCIAVIIRLSPDIETSAAGWVGGSLIGLLLFTLQEIQAFIIASSIYCPSRILESSG